MSRRHYDSHAMLRYDYAIRDMLAAYAAQAITLHLRFFDDASRLLMLLFHYAMLDYDSWL